MRPTIVGLRVSDPIKEETYEKKAAFLMTMDKKSNTSRWRGGVTGSVNAKKFQVENLGYVYIKSIQGSMYDISFSKKSCFSFTRFVLTFGNFSGFEKPSWLHPKKCSCPSS